MKICTNDGSSLREQGKQSEIRASLIEIVPCSKLAINASCELLKDAHESRHQVIHLSKQMDEKKKEYRELNAKFEALQADLASYDDVQTKLNLLKKTVKSGQDEVANLRDLSVKKEQVGIAENLVLLRDDLQKILQVAVDNANLAEGKLVKSIENLESELKTIQQQDVTDAIQQTNLHIKQYKDLIPSLSGKIEAAIARTSRAESEAGVLAKLLENDEALRRSIDELSDEISHWKTLHLCFGNNGIIALSIDDAGPLLSSLVNQLLECYENAFKIVFKTQSETASKGLKEDFKILVQRNDGSETDLADMSGGQKLWINDCVARGMALYLSLQGRGHSDTLYSDETDGAFHEICDVNLCR